MPAIATNTIRLHRVLRALVERMYRAFLDADAMAKRLPPNGLTGKVHQLDAWVGRAIVQLQTISSKERFGHSW